MKYIFNFITEKKEEEENLKEFLIIMQYLILLG